MLRIHRHYFSRTDVEQLRVEAGNIVDEIGGVNVSAAPSVGIRVMIRADIPTVSRYGRRRTAPPSRSNSQKFGTTDATPPGRRQPIPTIAIGSLPGCRSNEAVASPWYLSTPTNHAPQ